MTATSKWRSRLSMQDLLTHTLGEFFGTFMFLLMAFCATQIANTPSSDKAVSGPSISNLLFIALAFGFSLAVNCWVFFRISGGHFNPAVTLGMAITGATPPLRGCFMGISQVCAGIAAAGVAKGLLPDHQVLFSVTKGPGTSVAQALFLEMFLSAQLVITVLLLASEKHEGTFIAPIGIGLSLFIGHLAGLFFSGSGMNPARAFGPNVVGATFPSYHWIYWIGPFLGSLLAGGVHLLLKHLNGWESKGDRHVVSDAETGHVEVRGKQANE
ncbi:MAG: hypothetical protein M1840_007702 [Geoglossum simile]|nr:MAG: hypothetical protein M1840_007702 [Geoglossum simile]